MTNNPKKLLSMNDKRLDAVKKISAPVFYINSRIRVFTWENSPRHKKPIALILFEKPGLTASQIVAEYNRQLAGGKKLEEFKIIRGKQKSPEPAKLSAEEIEEIDNRPAPQILVKDWDRKIREVETLDRADVLEILNAESNPLPKFTLQDWCVKHPNVIVKSVGDTIYVYADDPELYLLEDYVVKDIESGGQRTRNRAYVLQKRVAKPAQTKSLSVDELLSEGE
jgi:hypothetical protein